MRCTNCGSLAIDFADSQAVCSACGVVLEESQIVSDITFAENTAGGAVVQGSYLGADQGMFPRLIQFVRVLRALVFGEALLENRANVLSLMVRARLTQHGGTSIEWRQHVVCLRTSRSARCAFSNWH